MAGRFGHVGWRQARGVDDAPEAAEQAEVEEHAEPQEDSIVPRLVLGLVLLYALVFAILSVQQHQSFQTHAFDLGNMDQAVWNTAEGRPLEFTNWEGGTNRLAAHVEPILLLVAQVYRFWPDPATLLVLQSVVISLGALPAFWLARRVLRSDFGAAAFAGSYLLSPALEIANLADFHAVAFSSALLLYAFYFVYRRQYWGFAIFAALAMGTKEHVPASVFLMGLYILLVQRQRLVGGVTCAVALIWAGLAFGVIIPHFNPQGVSPYLSRYDRLGGSPSQMVWNMVSNPGATVAILTEETRLEYLRSILGPTLYLGLLSPATLVMTVPDFAINLLSNFTESYAGRAHYGAVLVPFVTVSAILGAGFVRRLLNMLHPAAGQGGVAVLSVAVLVSSVLSFREQVLVPLTDHLPSVTDHHRVVQDVLKLIPPDAAVSAGSTLNPHVSRRRQLSLYPDIAKAEYIVLDVTSSPYPIDVPSLWYRVQQLLQSGQWGVVAGRDGVLLRRGGETTTIPDDFYSFLDGDNCKGGVEVGASFGGNLRLTRYRLEPANGRVHGNDPYAKLALCWEASGKIDDDIISVVEIVNEEGGTIYADRFQPALLWRPASQWQYGQRIQANVAWLPLGAADRGELRVSIRQRTAPYPLVAGMTAQEDGRNTLGARSDGSLALAVVQRGD